MGNAKLKDDLIEGQDFADELPPGSTLMHGQFTIDSFLNAGGFGITYSARDSLERRVVIKECFPGAFCRRSTALVTARSRAHTSELHSIVRLFVQEARSLAKLTHPNIVGVHQVFEENNTAYMALDYVEGRDLLEIIEDKESHLRPAEIEEILRQVLDAIGFVHAQGLLHRDISPDNILLDPSKNPVLIDFGAAREQASKKSRVLSALRVVKDGYSPQEFYISGSEQGPYSDLYALGASFYHLISGDLPPDAQTRLSAVASGEADPYVPLFGRIKGYQDNFLRSMDIALEILPKNRIPTAAKWLEMLDSADPIVVPAVLAKTADAAPKAAVASDGPKSTKGLMMASVAVIALVGAGAFAWQNGWLSTSATVPQDVAVSAEDTTVATADGAVSEEIAALEAVMAAAGTETQTSTPETESANAAILSQLTEGGLPEAEAETVASGATEQTTGGDTDSAAILSQLTEITTPDAGAETDAPVVAEAETDNSAILSQLTEITTADASATAETAEVETDNSAILSQLTEITTPDANAEADAPEVVAALTPEVEADSASILSQLTEMSTAAEVPEATPQAVTETETETETALAAVASELIVKPETIAPTLTMVPVEKDAPLTVPGVQGDNTVVIASMAPLAGPSAGEDLATTSSVLAVQELAELPVKELTPEETVLAAAYAAQQSRMSGTIGFDASDVPALEVTAPEVTGPEADAELVLTMAPVVDAGEKTEEALAPTQDATVAEDAVEDAPAEDVAVAETAPAAPAIVQETYDVPGLTSVWTVALPDTGTLFAVNGTPVDSAEAFDTYLRENIERPANDQLTVSLTLGDTAETAQTEDWILPVMQKTTFPNGLAFETRLSGGTWQTQVTSVPVDDTTGVQVGDVLFGHLQSTTFVDGRTTLPELAAQAYRGETDLGFAVTRDGSTLGVGLTLGGANTN